MTAVRQPGRRSPVAGLIWVVSLAVLAAYLGLVALGARADPTTDVGRTGVLDAGLALANLAFASVGFLVARARPGHPIATILQVAGLGGALTVLASSYATFGLSRNSGVPAIEWAAWLANWVWWPFLVVDGFLLPALYPNGHLPSARWRPLVVGMAAGTLAGALGLAFLDGPLGSPYSQVTNPLGIPAARPLLTILFNVGAPATVLMSLAALASVLVRLRAARGVERAQLKWFVASVVPLAIGFAITNLTYSDPRLAAVFAAATVLMVLALAALPIAIGTAILRYRLYDIDLIINRTLVYGFVATVLAGLFALANLGLQQLAVAFTGQRSDLVIGGLIVATAFSFGPLQHRVRPVVDRILPSRSLLALLFTDIVGSTETIVELGDERWRALLTRYRSAVRQELSRHSGREVNTAGDAFFATFERPGAALQCALAIRDALSVLGLRTRTGLHLGECEMRGEEVSGLAVHTAARVMSEASAGEVLISDAMRAAVPEAHAGLQDRGQHRLKGVPGEWHLYAVPALFTEGLRPG